MSVEGQEQAAWVALTNDPSAYTSTRPREVFAHGYRAASVDLHQQLVREHDLLLKERNPEHLGSLAFQLRALIVESEARERELEAERESARRWAEKHAEEKIAAWKRGAVLVEALKELLATTDWLPPQGATTSTGVAFFDARSKARSALAGVEAEPNPDNEWRWRCPDCGSGVSKVHATVDGFRGCGKPPGYWTGEAGA